MSTLSTTVNSYQHLSTKALYSNNEHIPKGLLTESHINTVNRDQHFATAMQQKIAPLISSMSTLSTDINTYQQLSTKALYSNNSNVQHTTKGPGTENHVNTVNRHQHTATAMQQSQQSQHSSLRK